MPAQQSKADIIEERRSTLPLPDEPPVKSDWNSADTSINTTATEKQEEISTGTADASSAGLREPASQGSGVREKGGAELSGVGRQGKEGLDGLPKDAKK